MKVTNIFHSASRILIARITGWKMPVAVRFKVTNHCTLRCKYCSIWTHRDPELSSEDAFWILKGMAKAGVQRLSLSGGDPLLRKDVGHMIDYARARGISVSMNSPGTHVIRRIRDIHNLDLLKLSLDGPEQIHDFLRTKGSYKEVLKAATTALNNGIKISFATTLTRYNIDHLEHMLDIAKEFNTVVAFQPLKELYKGLDDLKEIAPDLIRYKRAVDMLIQEKVNGNNAIRNSLHGLHYIREWPELAPLHCGAGLIFCVLEPNGDMISCDRVVIRNKPPNAVKLGFKRAFDQLTLPDCKGCGFCGSLELNYLLSFKWDILDSIRRIL